MRVWVGECGRGSGGSVGVCLLFFAALVDLISFFSFGGTKTRPLSLLVLPQLLPVQLFQLRSICNNLNDFRFALVVNPQLLPLLQLFSFSLQNNKSWRVRVKDDVKSKSKKTKVRIYVYIKKPHQQRQQVQTARHSRASTPIHRLGPGESILTNVATRR